MCAAHLEAQLAILDSCADEALQPSVAGDVLEGFLVAVFWDAPALFSDARLQSAVARCLQHIPQARVLVEAVCPCGLQNLAVNTPRICRLEAQLVTAAHNSLNVHRPFPLLLQGARLSCFSELQLFDAAVLSPRAAAVLPLGAPRSPALRVAMWQPWR